MKRFTLIWILLFAVQAAIPAWAKDPQQIFDAANQLYDQKKFDSAAIVYQQLINAGYRNTYLFYNAGNSYFKANRIGEAVYYYEKALRNSPGDPAVLHNLRMANQHVTDNVEGLPKLFFQSWWQRFVQWHSVNHWAVGMLVFAWLAILFFVLARVLDIRPRLTKWVLWACMALFLVYLTGSAAAFLQHKDHSEAIVITETVPVKSAPDNNSAGIMDLHEGLKVNVLDKVGEWTKIRLADGKTGWVNAGMIREL